MAAAHRRAGRGWGRAFFWGTPPPGFGPAHQGLRLVAQAPGSSHCCGPGWPPVLVQIRLQTWCLNFRRTFQHHKAPRAANPAMSLPPETLQRGPQPCVSRCFQPRLPPQPPLQTQPPSPARAPLLPQGLCTPWELFSWNALASALTPGPPSLIGQTLERHSLPPGSLPDASMKLKASFTCFSSTSSSPPEPSPGLQAPTCCRRVTCGLPPA